MPASPITLSILIPLHDEAAGIDALAARMTRYLDEQSGRRELELVLVDDGSGDATGALLQQRLGADPRCRILRHEQNRGLCAALATGLAAARGSWIAWLDSDLTYDPDILTALADAVAGGADVALASCYHPRGRVEGVAGWRRLLSSAASSAYRSLTRADLHTFTSMVRVYRRSVLEACAPGHPGFLGVTEVLLRALRGGARVVEVPAALRRRRLGQSKMRVVRVGIGHLGLMASWLAGGPRPAAAPRTAESSP